MLIGVNPRQWTEVQCQKLGKEIWELVRPCKHYVGSWTLGCIRRFMKFEVISFPFFYWKKVVLAIILPFHPVILKSFIYMPVLLSYLPKATSNSAFSCTLQLCIVPLLVLSPARFGILNRWLIPTNSSEKKIKNALAPSELDFNPYRKWQWESGV